MDPGTPVNGFPRARHLRLLLVLLATAGSVPSQTGHPRLSPAEVSSQSADSPRSGSGRIIYNGVDLTYQLVDGFAIHDGDMILGTPDRPARLPEQRRSSKPVLADSIPRRDLSAVRNEELWPGGIVPYVVEQGFTDEARQDIEAAIDHWNSETVITLTPRKSEADFVRFVAEPIRPGACAADLGRVGGAQSIWLGGPEGCGVPATIHEIGHAVGLMHEHQRLDRDRHVMVSDETLHGESWDTVAAYAPVGGSYDYASVMHYGGIETIPPGMLVSGAQLSTGDIDGVARLYGQPPALTTVSTNPPGLGIIVDGQSMTTPAQFDWLSGSEHILEAPVVQSATGVRYLFGRWNDEGLRKRTVTADPAVTWIEANYIVQRSLTACAHPPDAGTVAVHPEAPDRFHTIRTPVAVEARPAPGRSLRFREWAIQGGGEFMEGSPSANPGFVRLQPEPGAALAIRAEFVRDPLFRIDSNLASERTALRILMGGRWETIELPWVSPADQLPGRFRVEVPEVQPEGWSFADTRYRFGSWSDGGDSSRTVPAPTEGRSLTLNLTPEYRLRTNVRDGAPGQGSISAAPGSVDRFYPSGTQVTLTATPEPGRHFAGWLGDVSQGDDAATTVVMDGPRSVEAIFTLSQPLRAGEAKQVILPASDWPELHYASNGYNVWVPVDAIKLAVEFRSTPPAEADLYVNRDLDPWWHFGVDGRTRVVEADFESRSRGGTERIVINRQSTPPLRAGLYVIALDTPPSIRDVNGTLSASIKRSGIGRASPRAFTFSAPDGFDPTPQTVRMSHLGREPTRYRIESDRPWLTAQPREWTRAGPGIEKVAVAVHGAALGAGTHRGTLRVVIPDPDRPAFSTATGIELPVTFAKVGHVETVTSVSGVEIANMPRTGGVYGAGETIDAQVHFARPVSVTGQPELALSIGNRTRLAEWNRVDSVSSCGDAYASLAFRYAVEQFDLDMDGIGLPANGLTVRGGAIRDAAGADARLGLGRFAITAATDHRVNGRQDTAPEVTGLWFGTHPQEGDTFGWGEAIEVGVEFDIEIEVTGRPQLALEIDGHRVQAFLSGIWRDALSFHYVVRAEDRDPDGIGVPADALSLHGGTIRSLAGSDARLNLGDRAFANNPRYRVNGSQVRTQTTTP